MLATAVHVIYFERRHSNGATVPNFGDQLNCWMWQEALPDVWADDDGILFLGIGTIIDKSIIGASLLASGQKFVVFSSGVGYGLVPENFGSEDWHISSVRGPLSARALGLPPESAITDGAALISSLSRYKQTAPTSGEIVFMPHHDSEFVGNWKEVCEAAGFVYLSPTAESIESVERIRAAKLVLADAMHAAIVADSFRVPWIPLVTSSYSNTFKWLDWTLSVDLPYLPAILPPSSSLEILRERTLPLCGKRFLIYSATAESAMRDYYYKRKMMSSRIWNTYADIASKAFCGAPGRIYNSRPMSSVRGIDKRMYVELAAQALIESSRGRQYLSADKVHSRNLERMFETLASLPEIARELSQLTKV